MKISLLCLSLLLFSGCVSLDSVSVTPVPMNRSQKVKSEAERMIFLGFNFDNDYVNQITNDLKNQCTDGTVTGILTKTETINYFLFFFWKKRVSASGYCVSSKSISKGLDGKKRKPSEANGNDDETAVESGTL